LSTLKSINVIHPSSATNNIVNDASGNVAIGNNLTVAGTATVGGVAAVAVAPSTAGNVLTSTGSAWASTAPAGGGLPTPSAVGQIPFSTNGSTYAATQKIVQGTAVTLTSQTSVDFTSIPSWVKRITVMFSGVSTTGSAPIIQLGAGSVTTTGYVSAFMDVNGNNLCGVGSSTIGINFSGRNLAGASNSYNGSLIITALGSNIWTATGASSSAGVGYSGGGSITLSGTLDRIRLTTVNGTDTFDAGTVNILYE
jgi:hypothetical protein